MEKNLIAYFCTEFALDNHLPTYAGGLGVLAGDLIRQAAIGHFPFVGVGLYYHEGYSSGNWSALNAEKKLLPVVDEKNQLILVSLPIQDRTVWVKAWRWQEGEISVYLLDTTLPENSPEDQQITDWLYVADKETRIKQEMVLGIGGFRLLSKLGIKPKIFHLNEGHSAFLALELIRDEMVVRNLDFSHAYRLARKHLVFTNHTLVAAGQEIFSSDLVSAVLYRYAEELQIPMQELISLGSVEDSNLFSMTRLSLRLSGKINAVSLLHAQKATEIWPEYKMEKVTNGIFIPGWDKIFSSAPKTIFQKHLENKQKLLRLIKEKTNILWGEKILLAGWARRIVPYKRPLSILENIEALKKMAEDRETPLRLVFSGIAHNDDAEGSRIYNELKIIITTKLPGLAVYLPDYDLELAQILTAGCDVWLNTPVVGSEACGTSSMKAALNGVLPVTTADGWINEVNLSKIGWIVDSNNLNQSLLKTFQEDIKPGFTDYQKNPLSAWWLENMVNARNLIMNQFSMKRVIEEYFDKLYFPALKELEET